MRALVTGGCGFIGSHLVWRLVEDGHQVVVLDNLTTGRRENLRDLPPGAPVTVAAVDVAEYEAIAPRFDGVDVVFHLAGLADSGGADRGDVLLLRLGGLGGGGGGRTG